MPPKRAAADSASPPPQPTSSSAPAEETAAKKKKKPDATTLRKLTPHPTTAVMVREALTDLDSRKGVSSQAIQKYIKLKYPSADGAMLKHLVRKALLKGLESGTLARPPSSTVPAGAQGRFRLVKEPKPKKENADPNVEKAPKEAKEGVKQPQKTGAAKKKKATNEDLQSTENLKPPRKAKKDEAAAPAKKPKAKKAEAKESGKSSDSTKTKAKLTKEPKTEKDAQSKSEKAAGDAPVGQSAKPRRNK